ncbi:MAG: hypothetical protein ACTSXA_13880 [Candidatus Heimdallarchaeota archaeon]
MTLNDEIVNRLDKSRTMLQEVYDKLDPTNYVKFYDTIWSIRAEVEFVVASLKLLNNLEDQLLDEKWKKDFSETLKQVRADRKVREVFIETLHMFQDLESIENIIKFYTVCWKIKEKLTILLNVVKPKIKLDYTKNNKKTTSK